MSHKLLIGLEFDGEYDPRVRAELEQLVAGLQAWQPHVSPNDAEYVVGTASDDLTNERVATNSETIRVDRTSDGLIKWHAKGAGNGGAGYMMSLGAIRTAALESRGPMGPRGKTGAAASSSSTAGGHLHGLTRLSADGTSTTYNLLDVAEYVDHIEDMDPLDYTLSSDGTQVTFRYAPFLGDAVTIQYVIANL